MASPLLELDNVTKRFGRVVIAEDLSFTVGSGDVVGIVGPNGAGKTSLFGLISGDLAPGAGEVRFAGRTVTRLDASARCRLGIGRTYQVPRPFADMTVFENLLVAAQQGAGLRTFPAAAHVSSGLRCWRRIEAPLASLIGEHRGMRGSRGLPRLCAPVAAAAMVGGCGTGAASPSRTEVTRPALPVFPATLSPDGTVPWVSTPAVDPLLTPAPAPPPAVGIVERGWPMAPKLMAARRGWGRGIFFEHTAPCRDR